MIDRSGYEGKRVRNSFCLAVLVAGGLCILNVEPVWANQAAQAEIEWFALVLGLAGGLALFLAGLEQLAEGLKKVAGDALKQMLSKLTSNRVMGAVTGAVVTGILNSSSVTTVLVVSFVTAGVMSLQQSVGVIMGANIGSTVTAQILAFNISAYALLPVAVGFFLIFTSPKSKDQQKHWGMMIMGLGLVFFGMSVMSEAMYPLRSYQPFLDLLQRMEKPFLGIIAGALFTGLVQSSAATVGIAIAMASGGLLSLNAGISLALGANIGTCITALMAALGKPPEAVRAAVVHVSFNIAGVLLWLPFIQKLGDISIALSPTSSELSGVARMATEVPRQIANANTLFNIANTILFLPFTAVFALVAQKLVRDRPVPPAIIEPVYLDPSLLEVPSFALAGVRNELTRVAELIQGMFESYREALVHGDYDRLSRLIREDDKIDILERECLIYLGKIRTRSLTLQESAEHQCLMASAVNLETLADVIETDLIELASKLRGISYTRSAKSREMLQDMFGHVRETINLLVNTLRDRDMDAARAILEKKGEIGRLERDFLLRRSERLGRNGDAVRVARIDVSAFDKLHRMYSLSKHIARAHLAEETEQA